MLTLIGCGNDNSQKPQNVNRENMSQKEIDSVLDEFKFTYHEPVVIDSSDIIMIPVGTVIQRSGTKYRYESDSYDKYSYSKYWNFTFNNTINNTTKLLTDKKSYIITFSANNKKVGKIASKSVFYEIAEIDYNKDGKLNYEDPLQLFISNNDGTNLKSLSPINENLIDWKIIPNTDKLIIRTKRDVNNDYEFDIKDDELFYLIDLDNTEEKKEIINTINRNKIEQLYFDSWLSTKTPNI